MFEIERQSNWERWCNGTERGKKKNSEKTCPNAIFPPHISLGLAWYRTRASRVNIQLGWAAYFRAFCFTYTAENAN